MAAPAHPRTIQHSGNTREQLTATAEQFGWTVINDGTQVVYRKAPYSAMVDYRRGDCAVLTAQLFQDAPPRTGLMPRMLEDIPARGYDHKNKRVKYWLLVYH